MYRLENQVIDIYDDNYSKAALADMKPRIPNFIKTAAAPSHEMNQQRPEHAFALCLLTKSANKLLKFPIDNAADTFFSSEYLQRNYQKLPSGAVKIAAANILQSCKTYKIVPSPIVKTASVGAPTGGNLYIEQMYEPNGYVYDEMLLKAAAAEIPKNSKAFDESPYLYAIVKKASGGDTQCKYAMPTPEHVRMAVGYFDKYASEFTPADRHQFAHNVRMRAQELGVFIKSASLDKYAGVDGYNSQLEAQISIRKSCCIDDNKIAAYDRLFEKRASVEPTLFAQTLEELDKRAGLNRYYGGPIADAYAATFGDAALRKTASSKIDMQDANKRALVEQHFGKDVAELLAKEGNAAVEALPNDAKEILAAIESGGLV